MRWGGGGDYGHVFCLAFTCDSRRITSDCRHIFRQKPNRTVGSGGGGGDDDDRGANGTVNVVTFTLFAEALTFVRAHYDGLTVGLRMYASTYTTTAWATAACMEYEKCAFFAMPAVRRLP